MSAGRPWLHDGLQSRVGEDEQIGQVEQAGRVGRGVPPHPQRRRHPPARLDERPARPDRRADRAAVQRPGRQPLDLAGPAARRLRRPGRLVEPPRHRRLGPATRHQPRRHRGVRRGRPLGDGPLRRRPGRGDGLVDGRQHGLRARAAPPRAGHRDLRGRGRARRHVRHHARPAAPAARRGAAADRVPLPGAAHDRPGDLAGHHPAPVRRSRGDGPHPLRLHAADARQRADGSRRPRVPRHPGRVVLPPRPAHLRARPRLAEARARCR